ncbi:uncharacterized protein LOC143647089 isoform X13 [Tamandua tetradactyla]|uniref:uncharacterized protein LOC143647089 isoform X13 n=1 Tax=Tamandua tetradactyla TaxID=48850 RepID=UPI0040547053
MAMNDWFSSLTVLKELRTLIPVIRMILSIHGGSQPSAVCPSMSEKKCLMHFIQCCSYLRHQEPNLDLQHDRKYLPSDGCLNFLTTSKIITPATQKTPDGEGARAFNH